MQNNSVQLGEIDRKWDPKYFRAWRRPASGEPDKEQVLKELERLTEESDKSKTTKIYWVTTIPNQNKKFPKQRKKEKLVRKRKYKMVEDSSLS